MYKIKKKCWINTVFTTVQYNTRMHAVQANTGISMIPYLHMYKP